MSTIAVTKSVELRLSKAGYEQRVKPYCRWCWRTLTKKTTKRSTEGERTCDSCRLWSSDPDRTERWLSQRYARVQVLSAGARDIVLSTFSRTAIRDDFEILCGQPEQMEFGVWRVGRRYVECVQRRNGRYLDLFEHFDEFMPFTLAATADGKFKAWEKLHSRFWRGVRKLSRGIDGGKDK